jgi:hypothetical protein
LKELARRLAPLVEPSHDETITLLDRFNELRYPLPLQKRVEDSGEISDEDWGGVHLLMMELLTLLRSDFAARTTRSTTSSTGSRRVPSRSSSRRREGDRHDGSIDDHDVMAPIDVTDTERRIRAGVLRRVAVVNSPRVTSRDRKRGHPWQT